MMILFNAPKNCASAYLLASGNMAYVWARAVNLHSAEVWVVNRNKKYICSKAWAKVI